jgi:hypothetical protein
MERSTQMDLDQAKVPGPEKPIGNGIKGSTLWWWIGLVTALAAILGMHTFLNDTH